jgi:hypothetical protein
MLNTPIDIRYYFIRHILEKEAKSKLISPRRLSNTDDGLWYSPSETPEMGECVLFHGSTIGILCFVVPAPSEDKDIQTGELFAGNKTL